MKILIVEDNKTTIIPLIEELKAYHYIVDIAVDGLTGLELALGWNYDLVVLDWMLPKMDGLEICRQLRAKGFQKPILLLTVRNLNEDIITGLDAGADDFVCKPYSPSQILARIRALLRRGKLPQKLNKLIWENLKVDEISAQVYYNNNQIDIKPKAYNLLLLFLNNPQRIFSRQAIIDKLWSFDNEPSENAVTNLIKDLRRTLKEAGMRIDFIETVYGLGYRLNPPPKTELETQEIVETKPISSPQNLTNIKQVIAQYQDSFQQQLSNLEDIFVIKYSPELMSSTVLKQAEEIAHKLAGSLGTFGYDQGSKLAWDIENCLRFNGSLSEPQVKIIQNKIKQLRTEINNSP